MSLSKQTTEPDEQGVRQNTASKDAGCILIDHLKKVRRALKGAAEDWVDDPECVHRLRVSARKALAAVSLIGEMAPIPHAKWFTGKLKTILKSSGPARDLDVLLSLNLPLSEVARKTVEKILSRQRKKSQKPIDELHKKLNQSHRFQKHIRALSKELRQPGNWSDQRLDADACFQALSKVRDEFLEALQAEADQRSLHQIRIALRKFRYALEIAKVADKSPQNMTLTPELVRFQSELGLLQDHVIIRTQMKRTIPLLDENKHRKMVLKFLALEKNEIRQRVDAIRVWLNSEDSRRLRVSVRDFDIMSANTATQKS